MSTEVRFPVVVCCILETDAEAAARRIDAVPAASGMLEIRADHLGREAIQSLVRRSDRPVVVSIRRAKDGGRFDGSDETRRLALLAALEAGARFIDVEWDSPLADLASGPDARRVILSHHGAPCRFPELASLHGEMAATHAALLKIVPCAESLSEIDAVRRLLAESDGERRLASFALGPRGAVTRLLAPSWGSWGTYGSAEPGAETAEGQFSVEDLLGVHDVLSIGPGTRRFALVGAELAGSPSPLMHRAGYHECGIDARYFPIEPECFDVMASAAGKDGSLGLEAFGVTIPFKEQAARRCKHHDDLTRSCSAANTVVVGADGWHGYNTDGPAAIGLIRPHLDPRGARVAVVGAGGTSRALAAVFRDSGARVTLYNRTQERAREAASSLGVDLGAMDRPAGESWDLLVNATPLGGNGESVVPDSDLTGKVVLDVVYAARETPLIREARRRGLATVDGYEMLVAQAAPQFERMTGSRVSIETLLRAGAEWLGRPGR